MASSAQDIVGAYPQAGYDLAQKIVEVSNRLGIPDPGWLANLINFETGGSFSPSTKNPTSSATGLIQFISSTARSLGTTTSALASMSAIAQMDWVEKYLRQYQYKGFSNPTDLYMAVFYPVAMGDPNYPFPANVVAANSGISTPTEYAEKANARSRLPTGLLGVAIPGTGGVRVLPVLMISSVALLIGALAWWKFKK